MTQPDRQLPAETRPNRIPVLKGLLSRLLLSGAVLLTGLVVVAGLALILKFAGDDAGASAVTWMAWVAAACLALLLLGLLSSLTLAVLELLDQASQTSPTDAGQRQPADTNSSDQTTD